MSIAQRLMLESGEPYPNPGYLPYVLFAYDKIYNLYENLDSVLNPPYNTNLIDMYDGTYNMWQINNILPESPIDIFQDEYYQNYLNNEDHPFKLALKDNDTYEFTPQSPMRLIHCSGDDNVTYENSEIAYDYFIKSGAQNIELIDGGNLNHTDCAGLAILAGKIWIDGLAELCEPTSINEQYKQKEIVKQVDLLGREITKTSNNKYQISIYNDGSYTKQIQLSH